MSAVFPGYAVPIFAMAALAHHLRLKRSAIAYVAFVTLAAHGCGYDFDAPFGSTTAADASIPPDAPAADAAGQDTSDSPADDTAEPDTEGGQNDGPSLLEDCLNGIDDDGDGEVDCADTDCSPAFKCVPAAPAGWNGPSLVAPRLPTDPPAECAAGAERTSLLTGLSFDAALCGCNCGSPEDSECADGVVDLYTSSSCAGTVLTLTAGCTSIDASVYKYFSRGGVIVSPGECPASVDTVLSEASWGAALDLCTAPAQGGGCEAGQVCVLAEPALDLPHCVESSGDRDCPTMDYTVKAACGEGSVVDTRACSLGTCHCSTPSDGTCLASFHTHAGADCSGTGYGYEVSGCVQLAASSISAEVGEPYMSGGWCGASGSPVATGGVSAEEPHTLCCTAALPR